MTMADASQYFGSDLTLSATGDLLVADGLEESKQRILRRLLTNPGDYLWEPDYGAGLPTYIGRPLDQAALTALIKAQMYQEASVAHDPEPQVAVQAIANGLSVQIAYTYAPTGQTATLAFDVTP